MYIFTWILCLGSLIACGRAVAQEAPPTVLPGCLHTQTTSYKAHLTAGWNNSLQWFVAASDPQFPRTIDDQGKESLNYGASKSRLGTIFDDIASFRQSVSSPVTVMINGDLTDFGHGDERAITQELFKRLGPTKGAPLFMPGLGNHDYGNNVNDCANNGCARDSVCDVLSWTRDLNPHYWDYHFSDPDHYGSYGYAIDIGPRATFVQLNDSPTYHTKFETGVLGLNKAKFTVIPSLRWLEGVLRDAYARNRYVFINMHRRGGWPVAGTDRFKRLIEGYGVQAVFAGHLHKELGLAKDTQANFGSVPVFQSGSLLNMNYLIMEFRPDLQRYTIYKVARGKTHAEKEKVGDFALSRPSSIPAPDFADAAMVLYEGNNAKQDIECVVPIPFAKFNLPGPYGCKNDETRSLRIMKAPAGTLIALRGNWDHQNNQGYAFIEVFKDILLPVNVGTFERHYMDPLQRFQITRHAGGTLDGKISSMSMVTPDNPNYGNLYFYANANYTNLLCKVSVINGATYDVGQGDAYDCENDQAKAIVWTRPRAGFEICLFDHKGHWAGGANTCVNAIRNQPYIALTTLNQNTQNEFFKIQNRNGSMDRTMSSMWMRDRSKEQEATPERPQP